jgi:hypothetical protein
MVALQLLAKSLNAKAAGRYGKGVPPLPIMQVETFTDLPSPATSPSSKAPASASASPSKKRKTRLTAAGLSDILIKYCIEKERACDGKERRHS